MTSSIDADDLGHAEPAVAVLGDMLGRVAARWPRHSVELFARDAYRIRVSLDGAADRPRIVEGRERGVALRCRDLGGRSEGFAATTCDGAEAVGWLVDRARSTMGTISDRACWRGVADILADEPGHPEMPEHDVIAGWLRRALEFVEARWRDLGVKVPVLRAWVECAVTIEALVNDSGLRATRTRQRAWAMVHQAAPGVPDSVERPHVVIGPRFEQLDSGTWAEDVEPPSELARSGFRRARLPLLVTPSAAASLVPMVAAALHGAHAPAEIRVGPGWRLADDPFHPLALGGGIFDDAGFPASRTPLVRGERALPIDGPGHYRRGSYRDRPEPLPTCLVVEPEPVDRPTEACRVVAARPVALPDGDLLVEIDGIRVRKGQLAEPIRRARFRASPAELALACRGSFGKPRPATWGVTPGLVLEGLTLEG